MSDFAAIISSVAVLVTALAAAYVSITSKLVQIHALTNSSLKDVKAELAVSAKEVAGLRELVASMVRDRALAEMRVPALPAVSQEPPK